MESKRVLKREGLNLVVDKEILDDQRVLEVGTEVPDKAKVDDKEEFENYKVLYKGAIDDKCIELYGSCDDEKLWEDTAKELYLSSKNYIPEADKKADGELVDEKEPVKESKRVIKHNKITEAIELTDKDKEILRQKAYDMFKTSNKFKNDDKALNDYLDREVMPLWYEAQSNLGQHITENKKLNEEIVDFYDPDEVAEAFINIAKLTSEIEKWWEGINPQDRDRLDDEFTGTISDHIRWLGSNVNEILDNELKDYKSVFENKGCPKQN